VRGRKKGRKKKTGNEQDLYRKKRKGGHSIWAQSERRREERRRKKKRGPQVSFRQEEKKGKVFPAFSPGRKKRKKSRAGERGKGKCPGRPDRKRKPVTLVNSKGEKTTRGKKKALLYASRRRKRKRKKIQKPFPPGSEKEGGRGRIGL